MAFVQIKTTRRLWEHRWSLWHILKHSFQALQAGRYFNASQEKLASIGGDFPPHPRQPRNLARAATTTPRRQSTSATELRTTRQTADIK